MEAEAAEVPGFRVFPRLVSEFPDGCCFCFRGREYQLLGFQSFRLEAYKFFGFRVVGA